LGNGNLQLSSEFSSESPHQADPTMEAWSSFGLMVNYELKFHERNSHMVAQRVAQLIATLMCVRRRRARAGY
jgi:hypothetical protein